MRINLASIFVDNQDEALRSTPRCSASEEDRDPAGRAPLADRGLARGPGRGRAGARAQRPPGRRAVHGRRWSATASPSPRSPSTDVQAETERLQALGVRFTQEPLAMGPVTTAVLDDTCGNLIMIASTVEPDPAGSAPA